MVLSNVIMSVLAATPIPMNERPTSIAAMPLLDVMISVVDVGGSSLKTRFRTSVCKPPAAVPKLIRAVSRASSCIPPGLNSVLDKIPRACCIGVTSSEKYLNLLLAGAGLSPRTRQEKGEKT